MTLYIDTHDKELVIAILNNNKLVYKKEYLSNKHSEYIISFLKETLDDMNMNVSSIKEIIVINGPGSFTGVRIGCVVAKVMGYTLGIKVKPISYLQALSLNGDSNCIMGIRDKNGVFGAKFDKNHELVGDYFYLSNLEMANFKEKIIFDRDVDIEKVALFLQDKQDINPHLLKPLYVKRIEVQYD